MKEKKPLVVVLSRNYSTGLSVIRSLGASGYTVDLIASAYKENASALIAKSKYVHEAVEVLTKKVKDEEDTELVSALLSYSGRYQQKPVLFPTDDYTASVMDLHRDALSDIFVMPGIAGGGQGSLKHYMDKSVQGELARKVGILTPKEWVISLRDEKITIPEHMVYPCYCKPLESSLGYKQEMAKCDSEEELGAHLQKLRENFSNRSILVQEFLEIDEEIDMEGVCLDQEIVLPGIIWKRLIGKHDVGVPLAGKTFPVEKLGDFKEKILAFLREFHYFGMFDLGFNIVGDKIYFNENNLRSGGTNYIYYKSGVNLPEIFVKEILGEKHTEEETVIPAFGKTYIYEKVAWEDYLHGHMTKETLDRELAAAEIKIICGNEDEVPEQIFLEDVTARAHKMERREAHFREVLRETGWERDYARAQIKDAKDRLGITLADYEKHHFWKYDAAEQAEAYAKILRRRERNKEQKEACIVSAMETAGWEREYAEKQIKDARNRLGISYNRYKEYQFCLIPVEEQAEKYREILKTLEREKVQKEYQGEKPLVVVLSRNYSTGLAVIRSLGAAGYTVDLVANAHKPGLSDIACCSKYVRRSIEVVSKKVKDGEDTELLEALFQYASEKVRPVLFPADDYTASVMDMNRDKLKDIFVMPSIVGGKAGTMVEHMNKTVQGNLARKAGLLTPMEWIISLENDIVIPEDMVYPCFVKPIESITGYKREMKLCNDKQELRSHLSKLQRKFSNRSILVQEFLNIENEIDLSGVCLDQQIIIPAIIKKTNVAQYEKGVTLAGKVVPFAELGEIQTQIIEMMKSYHYIGMFDLEFNVVGDKIYFNEVNLRSGGPNYSYFMSGVNLPALFVKEATGQEHTPEEEKVEAYGKSFIYEKVAWDDYIHGFMTKRELDTCIAEADIPLLYSNEDPAPGQLFIRKITKTARKKKIKQKLKKIRRSLGQIKRGLAVQLRPLKQILLRFPQTKKANRRNPNSEKPRVIVAGRNYCSNLCMARSLGEAGYEVEVLRIFQVRPKLRNLMKILKPDAYSKYIKAYHVCVSRRKSINIVNMLKDLADPARKMLLIPADDLVASIADEYLEELSQFYFLPNADNKEGEINRLMSKGVQKELALAAGLPVLNSCVIRTVGGKFYVPETVHYPCFIKPNVSRNSSKSRMRVCYSERELIDTLKEFSAKKDIEMLVEDFVDIKKEYSILGISTKSGANGPGFFGAEEGGQNEHRGVAVTGRILPCETMQPLIDKLIDFVGTLKFDGLYDIDLIETTDGKVYFVEVNMRFGASGYAVTRCGVNLPGMFADYMIFGKPVDMNSKVEKTGVTFVSEKVLIEEYTMGRLSKSKLKECMNQADICFIKNPEDAGAYKHFKKFYPIASVMRALYKMRDQRAAANKNN